MSITTEAITVMAIKIGNNFLMSSYNDLACKRFRIK